MSLHMKQKKILLWSGKPVKFTSLQMKSLGQMATTLVLEVFFDSAVCSWPVVESRKTAKETAYAASALKEQQDDVRFHVVNLVC
jgi:hypothetical protein